MDRLAFLSFALLFSAGSCRAQTQVDLRTQSKSADFSAVSPTKPMTIGASLPGTCTTGQMFFVTTATAGQNLYGCIATNSWSLEAGGGGGGGSGVTVETAGTAVGSASTLNFTTGAGSIYTISSTPPSISVQSSADTGVLLTQAREQSGGPLFCAPATGSGTAYGCSMSPTLTQYTQGMTLDFNADVNGSGGPTTLNVDFLGAKSLKLADGATDPGPGDITAGRLYVVWYDGSVFRMTGAVVPAGVLGETQPTCGTGVRGRLWFVAGGTGTKDTLSVCAKDATNAYAWRSLY